MFTRFRQFTTLLLTAHFAVISAGPVVLHVALDQHDCHCLTGGSDQRADHDATTPACVCDHQSLVGDRGASDELDAELAAPRRAVARIVDDSPCGLCDFFKQATSSAVPTETAVWELQVTQAAPAVGDAFVSVSVRPFWSRGPPTPCQI